MRLFTKDIKQNYHFESHDMDMFYWKLRCNEAYYSEVEQYVFLPIPAVLLDVMVQIASSAPNTPFYYYDINFVYSKKNLVLLTTYMYFFTRTKSWATA